jgi:hypothetical protein
MKHAASKLLTRQDLFDWTGLDSAGAYEFQRAAIIDKPNNLYHKLFQTHVFEIVM